MPRLRDYRRYTAKKTGMFVVSTAAAGSGTAVLTDDKYPVKSQNEQDDLFKTYYLFRPDRLGTSDAVRSVMEYAPTAGQLRPDTAWGVAPAADEPYELHPIIDPLVLNECINEALKRTMILVEISLTPTVDVLRQNITAQVGGWLHNQFWVRQVGYLTSGESREECDPYSESRLVPHDVEIIGGNVYVQHKSFRWNASDTMYLKCLKPAYYHCRIDPDDWGTTVGLDTETTEAYPPEDWVCWGALAEAWDRYSQLIEPNANAKLLSDLREAAAKFSALTDQYMPDIPVLTQYHEPIQWGPRW
jgi:hypothetical protein